MFDSITNIIIVDDIIFGTNSRFGKGVVILILQLCPIPHNRIFYLA